MPDTTASKWIVTGESPSPSRSSSYQRYASGAKKTRLQSGPGRTTLIAATRCVICGDSVAWLVSPQHLQRMSPIRQGELDRLPEPMRLEDSDDHFRGRTCVVDVALGLAVLLDGFE